jgi:hypothetical protein
MLSLTLKSYIFGPRWFYGFDSIIELIAIVTCLLLVYYSYRCYKLTSERRFFYFSTAFLSLTLAFVSRIIGTMLIYLPNIPRSKVGLIARNVSSSILSVDLLTSLAFLCYVFFMILGLMALFLIVSRLTWDDKRVLAMLFYLVLISTFLGSLHYQFFYITTAVMLSLISYSYVINYKEVKSKNSKKVAIAFCILLVSHVLFIFVIYSRALYVITEVLQLLGFLFLLIPFISVRIKKPKKYKLIK